MRTLRSLGATISSTPLFLSFCPIRQRRPSSTPKSSIEVPCNDLSVTTTSWSVVGFEVRELLGERRARWLIENIGLVHHAAAELGEDERKRRQRGEQKKRGE